jgi:ABC-type branched-subunit amino acid transport system ATPase component
VPLLSIESLEVQFGGIRAVNSANLSLESGEIRGLIGPNGAGKTSIINAITGTVAAQAGRIVFEGHDLQRLATHEINRLGIGRTFQHAEIFADDTVFDNVRAGTDHHDRTGFFGAALALPSARHAERQSRDEALRLLEAFNLQDYRDQRAGDLPFGLLKRVDLARALATKPKLLLLDEPTSGMSESEAALTVDMTLALSTQRGITLLIVEHNMRVIMRLAQRITVLQSGRVLFEGTPQEAQSSAQVIEAYLGEEMAGA